MKHDCVKTLQVSRNLGQTPVWPFFVVVGGCHAGDPHFVGASLARDWFGGYLIRQQGSLLQVGHMAASYIRKVTRMAASYTPV
jgi:hypothetical protein